MKNTKYGETSETVALLSKMRRLTYRTDFDLDKAEQDMTKTATTTTHVETKVYVSERTRLEVSYMHIRLKQSMGSSNKTGITLAKKATEETIKHFSVITLLRRVFILLCCYEEQMISSVIPMDSF